MSNIMSGIFHFFLDIIEFFYKKKLLKELKKNLPKQINVLFDIGAHKMKQQYRLQKFLR